MSPVNAIASSSISRRPRAVRRTGVRRERRACSQRMMYHPTGSRTKTALPKVRLIAGPSRRSLVSFSRSWTPMQGALAGWIACRFAAGDDPDPTRRSKRMRPSVLNPLFASVATLADVGPRQEKLYAKLLGRDGPRLIDLLFHLPTGAIDRRASPKLGAGAPIDGPRRQMEQQIDESGAVATEQLGVKLLLPRPDVGERGH